MKRLTAVGLGAVVTAAPTLCEACTVCMGDPEAPMTRGMIAGIAVLLAITAAVLAGFASFFICLARRASAARDVPGMSKAG